MKKIVLSIIVVIIALTTCNDREDYFSNSNQNVKITVKSDLTACTEQYPGLIGLAYDFEINIIPE